MKLKPLTSNLEPNVGFTLTELLVVVALIGVLASVILAVINPKEYIDRANDSKRKEAINDIVRAAAAYNAANGAYPAVGTWSTTLTTNSDLKQIPTVVNGTTCADNPVNNFCYDRNAGGDVVIYTILRSKAASKQASPACTGAQQPHFWWRSASEQFGVTCVDPATGLDP